ncbi:MAG: NADH:flavin oxidoreductase, partial [Planctomycetaceae bacterium]|nr:NADH:flavin oxidoreductase [Planctomycetaceae bacterium]
MTYPRVSAFKTSNEFRDRLNDLGLQLPVDDTLMCGDAAPLAQSLVSRAGLIGNRFCILPMEGWDGTSDGKPTDLTRRRWTNFGLSGAKLIWGGEAVAVRHDGRANPKQLLINDANLAEMERLRELLTETHRTHFDRTDDLCIGLQLTHSGRYARPNQKQLPEPAIAYHHPILDSRVGVKDDGPLLSDDDLKRLIDDFVSASVLARKAGFTWVDVKHCHG